MVLNVIVMNFILFNIQYTFFSMNTRGPSGIRSPYPQFVLSCDLSIKEALYGTKKCLY